MLTMMAQPTTGKPRYPSSSDVDGNWTPPWRNCFDFIVVRHNWIGEGHSNYTLPGSFNLSGDQLWENPSNMGYSGIGYMMGMWQYYYRNFSYYPNSGCPYAFMTLWVDCYNCGGDPPGYKSKGWQVESPLIVDHTNPVFDGIEVIYGAEIDDYVSDVLIPDLQSRGIVYTADNQTGDAAYLYTRYMELVGEAIDDDDVVLVVKGDDPLNAGSDQGSWLHDFIGIDFVNGNGQFGYIDDAWEDLFHVDEPPCASQERSSEYWPKVTAGNLWWDEGPPPDLHLHTDGYGHGEYSCWVAPIPCEWFSYQGAKLRIRDDVNNWTHSDNLAPGDDAAIEIDCPSGTIPIGEPVQLTAHITESSMYTPLESSIKWSVQVYQGENWVDYGPHEDGDHQYDDSGYQSDIPEGIENWTGTTFFIAHLEDCTMRVRARLQVCGETFDDTCDLQDDPDITISAEPGPYWIDGPSIPVFNGGDGGWHTDALESVQVEAWGCYGCGNVVASMESGPLWEDTHPGREGLLVGQVQLMVCVVGPTCSGYIDIEIDGPQPNDEYIVPGAGHVQPNEFCQEPLIWNIADEDCGEHTIRVKWYFEAGGGNYLLGETEEYGPLHLSRVTQRDLVSTAAIYHPDRNRTYYGESWHCCPGVRGRGGVWEEVGCGGGPPMSQALLDCSALVTQLLRRLARLSVDGEHQFPHFGADHWRAFTDNWQGENPTDYVTSIALEDLELGDLIVWKNSNHVAIFAGWRNEEELIANTWESTPANNGAGPFWRDLDPSHHGGRHWKTTVFDPCP